MYWHLTDEATFKEAVKTVATFNFNGNFDLEVYPHINKRSAAQNRLYWMWVNLIAKDTGNAAGIIHGFLMDALGHFQLVKWRNTFVPATISSRDLTVEQFAELIDACEALAKELKVKLIYPMDYRFARYGNEKN